MHDETEQRLLGQIDALRYILHDVVHFAEKALPGSDILDKLLSNMAKAHEYQNRRRGPLAHRQGMQELYAKFIDYETGHPAEFIYDYYEKKGDYDE